MTLQELAQLGDTVGGILGTLVAGVSIVLVYLALRDQTRNNRNLQHFQIQQALEHDLNRLREDTLALVYRREVESNGERLMIRYDGRAAIEEFSSDFRSAENHDNLLTDVFFQDLYFVVGRFDVVLRRIQESELPTRILKELQRDLIFLYTGKCMIGLTNLLATEEVDKRLKTTVSTTGNSPLTFYASMMRFHRRMLELVGSSGM